MKAVLPQLDTLDVNEAVGQLREAAAAKKCAPCGCLHGALRAIEQSFPAGERPSDLDEAVRSAREHTTQQKYECLGCQVCFPANALNALQVEGDTCPTEPEDERAGWPPLPGDYKVVRYGAPVAVCALNSPELMKTLTETKPDGLSIVGTMHTENLGIERVIRNTLANPNLRFLVICGTDTQQAVGHLPGQSLESLFQNGLDERGRIVGAKGKRPVLKNVTREEVQAFLAQVEPVSMIGEENPATVTEQIIACATRDPGTYPSQAGTVSVERIRARPPQRLTLDKAGYFVVYPNARRQELMVEHYSNQGALDCVLEGSSPASLYSEAIERKLLTRLDHAAYLGRELARAEQSLKTGEPFVQDKAPGDEEAMETTHTSCGCGSGSCNGSTND